jgi:hypothetical protein
MQTNLMPGPLTGGAADNLGQEVLDAMERVLSAPAEVILCAVTFLETVQEKFDRFQNFPTSESGIWQPTSAPLVSRNSSQI